jgi:hypothetical protein
MGCEIMKSLAKYCPAAEVWRIFVAETEVRMAPGAQGWEKASKKPDPEYLINSFRVGKWNHRVMELLHKF